MQNQPDLYLSSQTQDFLEKFYQITKSKNENIQSGNDKTLSSVLFYERFRVALEYQEEQWVFKNAISRIIRRKYALNPSITLEQIYNDLINELSWANYINPESLKPEESERVKSVLERYLIVLNNAKSTQLKEFDLQKILIDWLACEIDEALNINENGHDLLINYTADALIKNIRIEGTKISDKENELQLKLAALTLIYKPDLAYAQYWVLNKVFPHWKNFDYSELKDFGRNFDHYFLKIDSTIHHPMRSRYLHFVRRNAAPFILIKKTLGQRKFDYEKALQKPDYIRSIIMDEYDIQLNETYKKVWRGTIRALVFILLTKVSLAFILEMPFDKLIHGAVNYLPLSINILLPPTLMFVFGAFIKSPPRKNRKILSEAVMSLLTNNKVDDRVFVLTQRNKSSLDMIFNFFYWVFSLAIIVAVVWLLYRIGFNVLSIILFFLFVSAVSFFSFRIRNIALELALTRSKDDALTATFEFLFLPFVRMGKLISETLTKNNPFILTLDFLIEAPLKTIIKIVNSWMRFVRSKKEEIEY